MTEPIDEITLTIPRDREFHRVAHLVLGGLALRLELTIENLEDFQIALDAILNRAKEDGEVTVAMFTEDGILGARIGPVDVSDELEAAPGDELTLGRVLAAVVDQFEVDGSDVVVRKRVRHG